MISICSVYQPTAIGTASCNSVLVRFTSPRCFKLLRRAAKCVKIRNGTIETSCGDSVPFVLEKF